MCTMQLYTKFRKLNKTTKVILGQLTLKMYYPIITKRNEVDMYGNKRS